MKKLLAVVAAVACATAAFATDYTWTGNGDDNRWSTAGNWEGGVAPDASDANIVVSNDTAVTIVLDGVRKANGFTLKGTAPVTLSAVDNTCYVTNDYSGNSNASFIKMTQAEGVFNLEARVHFPNRVDLHCEGAVHFKDEFSQGSHNLYPQCGKFYFEGDSKTHVHQVGVGYANDVKDKFCGLYFSDNAQFIVTTGFSMGTHTKSPSAEVVVDGDGVLLESNSSSTIGEAESSENLQRFVLKRGTVNLKWPTFASKRPAEFVQEGGTFTCVSYGMLGKSVNSRGQVLLKGGKFISQGQITGASGTPIKIVLDGGRLEVNGDVQCDIAVTANGGELVSSKTGSRKTNSFFGTLDVAAGGTLKTGGALPFCFERDITVDGEIELTSGSLVLDAAGVRRTTTSDVPWKLTIRDGAIFDIAQPCSYFWHLPDVLTEGTGGLRLAGRNACFVHSFAHVDGATTNVAGRGTYFANTTTSPGAGMPKAVGSWGLYYVGPYVWTGKGGDNKWSTAANWEGEVVPDAEDRTKAVDLSAATTVELDVPASVGCFLYASAAPNPTLTVAGENTLTLVGYDSYATCFEAVPSAHVVLAAPLKSERYANATYTQTSAFIGGATYELRTSTIWGASTSWAFCLGGRFVYNSTIAKLSQTTSYNLLSAGGGANFEPSEVVFGPEADIKFNYLFFDKQSFTANQKIVQDGATLSGKAVHVWRCAADFRSPSAYILNSGVLTLSEKLGVGSNYKAAATTFKRREGGSFLMSGGTLTTPVIECEENQNYIYLNGGTVVLGAGGFVKTDDTTERTSFTANDKPALNLGGVTIAPSAASVVGLDTVLTGEGGATVVAGEGLTFAADKTVSGAGTLIADGAVAFAGEIAGSPTIRARDGGTISFAAGATVTGCPTIEIPADGALDIAAGTTVSALRVTVGGTPLAEGTYAGRFGAGTLVVSSAMPDDSAWTGAAGDNAYFTADNWKSGTVPNGAMAAADFGNAVFAEATTITVGEDLTLKTLTAPGCAAGLTLEIADGKKLSLVDAGEIVIAVGRTLTIDGTVELPTQATPVKKVSVRGGGKLVLKGSVVNASALTTFTAYTPRLIAREGSEIELRCTAAGGVQFYAATADAYAPVPSKVTVAEGSDIVLCDIPSWYSITGDLSRFGAFSVDGGRVAFATGANFSRAIMDGLGENFETTIPLQTVTLNGGEFITPQGVRCLNPSVRGKNTFILNGGIWRQTVDCVMADADLRVELTGDATLDVPADVSFEADLPGAGTLTKTDVGQVALSGSAEGVTNLTVAAGSVSLGAVAAGSIPMEATVNLAKTGATLDLDYEGTATVRELWIGGRQRAKGLYSSETAPQPKWTSYFTGIGSLLVAEGDLPGALILVR